MERKDPDLGQGQDPKEVVKEVNKCREVAEEDKGQIEASQGHKCWEVKEVVEKVKEEVRSEDGDNDLDQEIGHDLDHVEGVRAHEEQGVALQGQGHLNEVNQGRWEEGQEVHNLRGQLNLKWEVKEAGVLQEVHA